MPADSPTKLFRNDEELQRLPASQRIRYRLQTHVLVAHAADAFAQVGIVGDSRTAAVCGFARPLESLASAVGDARAFPVRESDQSIDRNASARLGGVDFLGDRHEPQPVRDHPLEDRPELDRGAREPRQIEHN